MIGAGSCDAAPGWVDETAWPDVGIWAAAQPAVAEAAGATGAAAATDACTATDGVVWAAATLTTGAGVCWAWPAEEDEPPRLRLWSRGEPDAELVGDGVWERWGER